MAQPIDISAFLTIRDQYAADLDKAERDVEKAKEKLESAKARLQTANDMISKATGGKGCATKPLAEEILRLLSEYGSGGPGLSAKEIRDTLAHEGNISELAAIHVTADRLERKGIIEMQRSGDVKTKLYRKKVADASDH